MNLIGPIMFLLAVIGLVVAVGGMMSNSNNRYPGWLLLIALVLGILGYLLMPAAAHDHSRPALDGWFKSLKSRVGTPCCDGSDYKGLVDVDWESKGGRYRVRIEGEWVDVPDSALVDGPNLAGVTMVWPTWENGKRAVRCFKPGSMG